MEQKYNFNTQPIYTSDEPGYEPVIVVYHKNFEHHILFSLIGYGPNRSIDLFLDRCDKDMIGFDMEWISTKFIPKYAPDDYIVHVEQKAKEIVCTMQFGCATMSLILCLPWIYFNDKLDNKPPWNYRIEHLIAGKLTCFGGDNDLRVLRANYPSVEIVCDKIWDPIILLKKLGADRPNLISMAKLLLKFDSDKETPNIDWIHATIGRLVQTGEDAILSYLIYNQIKSSDKTELSIFLTEHSIKETAEIRKSRITECRDSIIKKIYYGLNEDQDGIEPNGYIAAVNSFLGTMKLPDINWDISKTEGNLPKWRCVVTLNLEFSTLKALEFRDTKKEAKNHALRSVLKHSTFKSVLDRFLD